MKSAAMSTKTKPIYGIKEETSEPPIVLASAKIPKATKGNKMPMTRLNTFDFSNTPAAEAQRPIIILAQNKETYGATWLSSLPRFCFMNSGKLLAVATSTPT